MRDVTNHDTECGRMMAGKNLDEYLVTDESIADEGVAADNGLPAGNRSPNEAVNHLARRVDDGTSGGWGQGGNYRERDGNV